ncbi:MAG: homoserine dehydrogenase [Clostridia bacterium]|nr:homoserine dehydrogenase [Clostridia bacterium]
MTNIAILGFGVVGGGTAELITKNKDEVAALGGDTVNIKYILDLRDFPNSPLGDRVVHDFEQILSDPEIDTVIEVMGGSHPAYEYTAAALRAGKNVITSNKEVVATYGDELLEIAREAGVSYRFEAAVGGGIPVISPIIGFIRQNRITEVRGILNGTTNYILTKMFTLGESFEASLADAQSRGYAERNPDADILGLDAARKIAILAALVTDRLYPTDAIHTEGIVGIRAADVSAADKLGRQIKLLGRCIIPEGGSPFIMVAPFLLPSDAPLSTVSGVYNAVEVLGEPIGSAMFFGPGAGAAPTASAVVGDLMQIMRSGTRCATPSFTRGDAAIKASFEGFVSRHYLAFPEGARKDLLNAFVGATEIEAVGECAIVTEYLSESELNERLAALGVAPLSHIRLL